MIAPARIVLPADQGPGIIVEIGIETGQHHRAMRQARDRRQQFGRGRHRPGGAGGNHRAVGRSRAACAPPRSTGRAAPLDSIAPRSSRIVRPMRAHERQELQRAAASRHRLAGHQPSRRSHGICRVVMSSIRRARSSASAVAAAGVLAISGVPAAPRAAGDLRPATDELRQQQPPLQAVERRGRSSATSPSPAPAASRQIRARPRRHRRLATMRGRIAASVCEDVEEQSRASRQARRVGRYSVTLASRNGSSPAGEKPGTSRPSSNAWIRTGRNGADAGIVKMRGSRFAMGDHSELVVPRAPSLSAVIPAKRCAAAREPGPMYPCHCDTEILGDVGPGSRRSRGSPGMTAERLNRALQDRLLGRLDGIRRADMHPQAFEPQAVQPFRFGGAVEQHGQREFAAGAPANRLASKSPRPHRRKGTTSRSARRINCTVGHHAEIAAAGIADAARPSARAAAAHPCFAGSNRAARRERLDLTPSIHSVSELSAGTAHRRSAAAP